MLFFFSLWFSVTPESGPIVPAAFARSTGSSEARRLARLAQATRADEFMLVSDVFDPALRLRSLDITAAARNALAESLRAPA